MLSDRARALAHELFRPLSQVYDHDKWYEWVCQGVVGGWMWI